MNTSNHQLLTLPPDLPVVDSHIHLARWNAGQADFIEQCRAYRRINGLKTLNIVIIAFGYDQDASRNVMAAIAKCEEPAFYAHAGLIYPTMPVKLPFPQGFDPLQQLKDAMEVGFDGIKMIETKPDYRKALSISPTDAIYEPYFAYLEEQQIPLVWHANDPAVFWDADWMAKNSRHPEWCYADGSYLGYEEIYAEVYEVLRRHPGLTVTFPHLFFMGQQPDRLEALFEACPNLSVDITPGTEMFPEMSENQPRWKDIFTRWADRFQLGTDYFTNADPDRRKRFSYLYTFLRSEEVFTFYTRVPVHGLGLEPAVVEKILSGNFLRRAGASPRPIDRDALASYIRKYEPMMTDQAHREHILRWCHENGIG